MTFVRSKGCVSSCMIHAYRSCDVARQDGAMMYIRSSCITHGKILITGRVPALVSSGSSGHAHVIDSGKCRWHATLASALARFNLRRDATSRWTPGRNAPRKGSLWRARKVKGRVGEVGAALLRQHLEEPGLVYVLHTARGRRLGDISLTKKR